MTEIFEIPCEHEACTSGTVYMKYQSEGENLHFVLADTKKLIDRIRLYDQPMFLHALDKYEGDDEKNWLRDNSKENPLAIGWFALREDDGIKTLTYDSGWAGYLILIKRLGLPYVPIVIHKWPEDEAHLEYVSKIIGVETTVH